MNKFVSIISKAGVAFMVIALAAACNQQPKTTTETIAANNTTDKSRPEIVYVNSDSLLNNYEYFKEVKQKFESKSKSAQTDLGAKSAAFQREVQAYQQSANTLSADQRAATEQRLARKQQELQTYQQNAGSSLQNEEAAENEKLYEKVASYLKAHAKEKGYKMVLTYVKGNSALLFADESLDVTKDVIKGLNAEYAKEKK